MPKYSINTPGEQWKVWHLRVWVTDRAAVWSLSRGGEVMGPLPVQECCCPAVKQRRIKRRGAHTSLWFSTLGCWVGEGRGGLCLLLNWWLMPPILTAPPSTLPLRVRPHLPSFNIGCGAVSMARYHLSLNRQKCHSWGGLEHSKENISLRKEGSGHWPAIPTSPFWWLQKN